MKNQENKFNLYLEEYKKVKVQIGELQGLIESQYKDEVQGVFQDMILRDLRILKELQEVLTIAKSLFICKE